MSEDDLADRLGRPADPALLELATHVESLTNTAEELIEEVRVRQEQLERDRRLQADVSTVLRSTKRLVILMLICIVGLIVLANVNRGYAEAIRQCTTPQGRCAQAGAVRTAAAILDIEVKRNLTEIGAAQERGDLSIAEYRKGVVRNYSEDVAALNRYADQIGAGENNVVPPTLHPAPGSP